MSAMNALDHGVSKEEYEKIVKHPMDLDTIKIKLDTAAYDNVSSFSKDVNQIFENVLKVWSPGQQAPVTDAARKLQNWWIQQWEELVSKFKATTNDTTSKSTSGDNCSANENELATKPSPQPPKQEQLQFRTNEPTCVKVSKPEEKDDIVMTESVTKPPKKEQFRFRIHQPYVKGSKPYRPEEKDDIVMRRQVIYYFYMHTFNKPPKKQWKKLSLVKKISRLVNASVDDEETVHTILLDIVSALEAGKEFTGET